MKLDHVTIRTRDLQATRNFFLSVFDLKEGERPLAIQRRIPGHWLYSEGHPLVHIIGSQGHGSDRAAEAIDHVGFRMHSEADVVDRFRCAIASVPLRADDVDEWMAFRIEPVAGNAALYGERSLAFLEIEDRQEEVPCGLQIAGANGDVIEFHVKAPFPTEVRAFTSSV